MPVARVFFLFLQIIKSALILQVGIDDETGPDERLTARRRQGRGHTQNRDVKCLQKGRQILKHAAVKTVHFVDNDGAVGQYGQQARPRVMVLHETQELVHGGAEISTRPKPQSKQSCFLFAAAVRLSGRCFAWIVKHGFKLVACRTVYQSGIGFRRPSRVIAKTFGGRAAGRIKKDDLADSTVARLCLCPFPRRQGFTGSTRRQQQDAVALLGNALLEAAKGERGTSLRRDVLHARIDDAATDVIGADWGCVHDLSNPLGDVVSFAYQTGRGRVRDDHASLHRQQQGTPLRVVSHLACKRPCGPHSLIPGIEPRRLVCPGQIGQGGNRSQPGNVFDAVENGGYFLVPQKKTQGALTARLTPFPIASRGGFDVMRQNGCRDDVRVEVRVLGEPLPDCREMQQ